MDDLFCNQFKVGQPELNVKGTYRWYRVFSHQFSVMFPQSIANDSRKVRDNESPDFQTAIWVWTFPHELIQNSCISTASKICRFFSHSGVRLEVARQLPINMTKTQIMKMHLWSVVFETHAETTFKVHRLRVQTLSITSYNISDQSWILSQFCTLQCTLSTLRGAF